MNIKDCRAMLATYIGLFIAIVVGSCYSLSMGSMSPEGFTVAHMANQHRRRSAKSGVLAVQSSIQGVLM